MVLDFAGKNRYNVLSSYWACHDSHLLIKVTKVQWGIIRRIA